MAKTTTKTIISSKGLKLRHVTGAYLHMADAPTEDDILFFLSSQKHKASDVSSIIKAFGEHKADKVEAILRILNAKLLIRRLDGPGGSAVAIQ